MGRRDYVRPCLRVCGTRTAEANDPETSITGARTLPKSSTQSGSSGHTVEPSGRRHVTGEEGSTTA